MGMLQLVVLAASIAAAHAAAAAPLNIAEATYLTDYPVRAARFACCQQRQTQRSASACPPPALSLPDHPAVTLPPLRPRCPPRAARKVPRRIASVLLPP
jgi:hypothetical protein